ncbi:PPE family protein [Mycolicibacillus trivialis]
MFMDFGVLPPEINSIRIYTGPGAGPLLAASTAWQGLAAELSAAAAGYHAQVSDLALSWHGAGSQRMTAAAAPHIQWLNLMSAQAEQVGMQAAAQAAAYESAFIATTPPPVIAANRSLKMALIATNILGQNTPAIMATEALYLEMWAQCAAAMYAYAAATEQSSALPQFSPDHHNANPAGPLTQAMNAGRTAADTAARTALSGSTVGAPPTQGGAALAGATPAPSPILGGLSTETLISYLPTLGFLGGAPYDSLAVFYHLFSVAASMASGLGHASAPSAGVNGALGGTGAITPGLLGGLGNAGAWGGGRGLPIAAKMAGSARLGGLSVPGSWSAAAKGLSSMGGVSGTSGAGAAKGAGHMLGGLPLSGARGAGRSVGDGVVRVGPRPFAMSKPLPAG